jgi:DNA-binding response OmpR family regulator
MVRRGFMSPTLLVADGDAELCDLYRMFLTESGYTVETAVDGLDCLAKLRSVTPAVLVLDRDLRWGGGDGVLARLREAYEGLDVPVIFTTAGDRRTGPGDVAPPVVRVLTKPFAMATLLESVREAIAAPVPVAYAV